MENLLSRIESNPGIMLGKPVIKGTRIPVELVLLKISGGYSFEEVLEMHPSLIREDILAAIAYAADAISNERTLELAS